MSDFLQWQIAAGFGLLLLFAAWTLYRWHTDPKLADFCMVDLIAEDGKLSSRKFMEVGSFLVASAVVVATAIRGTISWEWIAGYCTIFVLGRAVGQSVHAYSAVQQSRIARQSIDLEVEEDDNERPPARRRASIIR